MNEVTLIIVTIVCWSLIVAMVLSQKGVRTGKSLLRYGVFGYTKPEHYNSYIGYFSTIGLFFYIIITPATLITQIVLFGVDVLSEKARYFVRVHRERNRIWKRKQGR